MAKFTHLFNNDNTDAEDLRTLAQNQYAQEKDAILTGYQEYLAHIEDAADKTLLQGLQALGVEETTSRNGHPSLRVGDPNDRVSLAKNTLSAINAILAMAADKYRVLDPNYHLAWFDPRVDAEGILTVWSADAGRWIVFDWKNGMYMPSRKIVPQGSGTRRTEGNSRYYFQSEKHQAIRDYLISKDLGTSYLVVMNFEEQLTHHQTVIRDRKEMVLTEVWEKIAQDWKDSNVKRQLTGNGNNRTNSVPVSEDREEFIGKLTRFSTDYYVTFTSSATSEPQTILFPASDPAKKQAFIKNVRNASPSVVFTGFEKVD
jgi:hypothetical protein